MPQEIEESFEPPSGGDEADTAPAARMPFWKVAFLFLIGLILLVIGAGWLTRERIADDLIAGELAKLGISAQYEIESIGTSAQILRNVVIGDPRKPDLTIERVIVRVNAGIGGAGITGVTLEKARLYGTYLGGKLSFGSLDPVLFSGSEEPFSLPNLNLDIVDGRAQLLTDYGAVGIKAEGAGRLSDGFSGTLAAIAPNLAHNGCSARGASIYGRISVKSRKPHFSGPVRLAALSCPDQGASLASTVFDTDITADAALNGAEGRLDVKSGRAAYAANRMAVLGGNVRFTFRQDALTARYALSGKGISTSGVKAETLSVEGHLRALDGLARMEVEGTVDGESLGLGAAFRDALAAAGDSAEGTLAQDVLDQIRTALAREERGSTLSGSYIVRRTGEISSIVVPRGVVRGNSGSALLSISRLQVTAGGAGPMRLSGNFATGGRQLPQIAGRMEQQPGAALTMRIRMSEYKAGSARLAVPRLMLVQSEKGGLGFAGQALVSGSLPGGSAEGLVIPVEGNWSQAGGLSLWRKCVELEFERLQLSNVSLERRSAMICPPRGRAIVSSTPQGLKIAGGTSSLHLAGRLGETPIVIESGPVGFAWPGVVTARSLDIGLGPAGAASNFRISQLTARVGSDVMGTFEGAAVRLDAVPLDIVDTSGNWRFSGGKLTIQNGGLRLEDREQADRFQPLIARDVVLALVNNVIEAEALLREPQSDRAIVRTRVMHNLTSGQGHADLMIDGVVFDDSLQPDTLSRLALGVIASAKGVVRGTGRIDWGVDAVTSSGSFTTDDLDFAAAFGPVDGVSGTVRFTDLLGLVTAPDQKLKIAAINPGIEVLDGVLTFAMRPDNVVEIKGAKWPFLGGTLRLEPASMIIGSDDPLRYTLSIEGLDAALFVEQMDLGNLSATGTFDGTLPLLFDQDGGHIRGGMLLSRPPGGNVSYVGELTYKDLSFIANFAFDALRSLDYDAMTIGLDGELDGEMVTRVRFSGVGQGEGATSNFLTRRIARLPLQFNVNLRAPFFQLITSARSLYDPAFVRDPRSLGLIEGAVPAEPVSPSVPSHKKPIQPSESDIDP